MFNCKVEEHRACQEYETVARLKSRIKISTTYNDFEKREELVELLDELRSYLFDKIES